MQQTTLTILLIRLRTSLSRLTARPTGWLKHAAFYLFQVVLLIYETVIQAGLFIVETGRFLVAHLDRAFTRFAQHPVFDWLESTYRDSRDYLLRHYHCTKGWIVNSHAWHKLRLYAQLTRLDKPIGTLLLLWPTLIALWLAAGGMPNPLVLFVFVTGVFLMRSAGCAMNDFADRNIDGRVKRTTQRPLATGKLQAREALIVFTVLSLAAFALVLLMNRLTILLSVAGVILAASYPFMKRYHYLPQVHLGAAFGWAVPMAYAAQAGEVNEMTWLIFLFTVLWATVYDTMYAMVDYDDDIKIGVKSTAILFGNQDKLIIGIIQCLLILNLLLIGHKGELSGFYYLGVTAASVFAIYQQYLIRHRIREDCFKAFLNNNWFGFVLFVGVVLDLNFARISS